MKLYIMLASYCYQRKGYNITGNRVEKVFMSRKSAVACFHQHRKETMSTLPIPDAQNLRPRRAEDIPGYTIESHFVEKGPNLYAVVYGTYEHTDDKDIASFIMAEIDVPAPDKKALQKAKSISVKRSPAIPVLLSLVGESLDNRKENMRPLPRAEIRGLHRMNDSMKLFIVLTTFSRSNHIQVVPFTERDNATNYFFQNQHDTDWSYAARGKHLDFCGNVNADRDPSQEGFTICHAAAAATDKEIISFIMLEMDVPGPGKTAIQKAIPVLTSHEVDMKKHDAILLAVCSALNYDTESEGKM